MQSLLGLLLAACTGSSTTTETADTADTGGATSETGAPTPTGETGATAATGHTGTDTGGCPFEDTAWPTDTGCGCWAPVELDVLTVRTSDTGVFEYACTSPDCCAQMNAELAQTRDDLVAQLEQHVPDEQGWGNLSGFDESLETAVLAFTEMCSGSGFDRFEVRDSRVCGDGRLEVDFWVDDYLGPTTAGWLKRHYFVMTAPGTDYTGVSTRTVYNCGEAQQDSGLECKLVEVP